MTLFDAYRVQQPAAPSPLSLPCRFAFCSHNFRDPPVSYFKTENLFFKQLTSSVSKRHTKTLAESPTFGAGAVSLCHLDEPSLTSCTRSRPCLRAATLLSINFRNCTAPQPRTPAQTAQRCHQQRTRRELQGAKGSARCARPRTRMRARIHSTTPAFSSGWLTLHDGCGVTVRLKPKG